MLKFLKIVAKTLAALIVVALCVVIAPFLWIIMQALGVVIGFLVFVGLIYAIGTGRV